MATTKPIDYDALYDELMRVCLGPEYYSAMENPMEFVAAPITAGSTSLTTIRFIVKKSKCFSFMKQ